jgi:UDP-2,3-diacylglucosamine hydrolase
LSTLFISDLHLHPSRPAIIDCFLRFAAQQSGRAEALYILGDLFEAWIGDDDPEPVYAVVRNALKDCVAAGTPIFLMHGNRDFLIGAQFAEQTGCSLLQDPVRIDLYGTPTLLMHGDTLCTDDIEYQSVRRKLRDPAWQQGVLELPVQKRLELAREAREFSSLATQGKDEYIMDVNPREVIRVIREHRVELLIHGHTHRPGIHTVKQDELEAIRIVLGDWYERGSVLVVDAEDRQLQPLNCH